MPIQVVCPSCQRQVTVAEQLFGQNIACPHCQRTFRVAVEVQDVPPTIQTADIDESEIRRKVTGPAIGLIVTGCLTTVTGLLFLPALVSPELVGQPLPWDPIELLLTIFFMVATLLLGIVTLFGSIKMLQLQNHPLAMAAAIAAMIPWYCCLIGLPFGIWAVVVLRDPDVKRAFK